MRAVIGIDTSCYTTSVAAADENGSILCSNRLLLKVPAGECGLRQSEAVFAHVRQLPELFAQTLASLKPDSIAAVCVSSRPRDSEDSYMPVFCVGQSFARVIADSLSVPLCQTTHQRGHLRAALQDSGLKENKYLAFHLSGGTTELLVMDQGKLRCISGTLDLHAGQLVDRIGVRLGLSFPSGPSLEALAVSGNAKSLIPVSIQGLDCHLSGAEAQIMRFADRGVLSPSDIAAEVYDVLARTVLRMLCAAAEITGIRHALLTGGVISSPLLRKMIADRCEKRKLGLHLFFGLPQYAGDNAAGVALIGADSIFAHKEEC